MTRILPALAAFAMLAEAAAAQPAGGSPDTIVAPPARPDTGGCEAIRGEAMTAADRLEERLRQGDADTRRRILLRQLMQPGTAALFPCLPPPGGGRP